METRGAEHSYCAYSHLAEKNGRSFSFALESEKSNFLKKSCHPVFLLCISPGRSPNLFELLA